MYYYLIESLQKPSWVAKFIVSILQIRKQAQTSEFVQVSEPDWAQEAWSLSVFILSGTIPGSKFYSRVYPKEAPLKIKLIPNHHIFTWHLQVLFLYSSCVPIKRRAKEENLPMKLTSRKLIHLRLGKPNKVSQADPRNVFSLTRLEWLYLCLSAPFAGWNRQCQPVLTFCASSSYIPAVYRGVIFPRNSAALQRDLKLFSGVCSTQ